DKIAKKFTSLLKKEFKVDSKIEYTDNMILISAYSKPLAHFFFQFGKKDKKSLPSKYLVNNKPYIKGLLDGLIDSDGHIEANGRVSFYNTSEELKELFEICCFILNKTFQSSIREPRAGNLKNCNIENCKSAYQVRIHTSNRKSKNYWYSIILSAEETEILQE